MSSRSFLVDVLKGETLEGPNYQFWARKIQYVLHEQDLLDHLTMTKTPPSEDSPLAMTREYQKWAKKDRSASHILLGSMRNDLIKQFEVHSTAKALWESVKEAFEKVDVARHRAMTMTFDTFKMASGASIHDHLRKMTEMINDLLEACSALTDEQKISSVLSSLPDS